MLNIKFHCNWFWRSVLKGFIIYEHAAAIYLVHVIYTICLSFHNCAPIRFHMVLLTC